MTSRFRFLHAALALCLVLAGMVAPAPRAADPALAIALAAGALCQAAPDSPGAPGAGHAHDNCLACQTASGPAALADGPRSASLARLAAPLWVPHGARMELDPSWPAYASRAPPEMAG